MFFYRWVIDPNILISYCISARLHELPSLIEKYNLEFCANNILLEEFSIVIEREKIKNISQRKLSIIKMLQQNF